MIESMIIAGCMLVALLCMTACSDKLEVQQMYEFDLATLPVQTTIIKGEEADQILHQVLPTDRQRGASHGERYGVVAERPVSVTGRNVQALLQVTWHRPAENRHLHP